MAEDTLCVCVRVCICIIKCAGGKEMGEEVLLSVCERSDNYSNNLSEDIERLIFQN